MARFYDEDYLYALRMWVALVPMQAMVSCHGAFLGLCILGTEEVIAKRAELTTHQALSASHQ